MAERLNHVFLHVFSNESTLCMRWPKYWSFSFSISPSNEHPGLISFRMDWLDLLAVQGTLKSLLQHNNSKASILQCSAFFRVQLSLIVSLSTRRMCISWKNKLHLFLEVFITHRGEKWTSFPFWKKTEATDLLLYSFIGSILYFSLTGINSFFPLKILLVK